LLYIGFRFRKKERNALQVFPLKFSYSDDAPLLNPVLRCPREFYSFLLEEM